MASSPPGDTQLSVVVPLYNEAANIPRLIATVTASLAANPRLSAWELACVNDGSLDDTLPLLERHRVPGVTVTSLPERRGQSAALWAGIAAARYGLVGRLDGDLQTTPDDFGPMLDAIAGGADCVHGVRTDRHDALRRRVAANVARAVRQAVIGDAFRDISCPLSVFRRRCIESVPLFDGFHRFLPHLIRMQGYDVREVPVRHFPRTAGASKYGVTDRIWVGLKSLAYVRGLTRAAGGKPLGTGN